MQGHHSRFQSLTRQCLHLAKVNIIEWKCSQITSAVTIQQVCNRGPATSAKIANITKNCKNFKWSNIQRRLKNSKVAQKIQKCPGYSTKIQAVQKIQLRPKYEQIQKWPKKFKKWSKHSTKFQVVQKIQLRRKSKSTLSNTRNWISQCSIKRDNTLQMLPITHSYEKILLFQVCIPIVLCITIYTLTSILKGKRGNVRLITLKVPIHKKSQKRRHRENCYYTKSLKNGDIAKKVPLHKILKSLKKRGLP